MKKKLLGEPIISPEILAMAKKSVEASRVVPGKPCAVCGATRTPATTSPNATDDDLCWVCRRLKISAWRDNDGQIAAQE